MPAILALLCGNAVAGIITYSGSDDAAGVGGPFPNSTAAQAAFQAAAAALSPLGIITFEDQPVGFSSSFTAAPGVTISISAGNYDVGYSGINNTTFGSLYGSNTTPGGTKWLGFPIGSATFSFASPTDYFGFWITGAQSDMSTSISVTFNDGAAQTLYAPINSSGGASFFGFTDGGAAISSITISNTSNDAWGIDDISYDVSIPEPASFLLLGSGMIALAVIIRRKLTR